MNNDALRAIAFSMDVLSPGFYFWLNGFALRIGGELPDDEPYRYPGKINSPWGIALVLPGYHIFEHHGPIN